jgi:hypothetical protein
MYRLQLWPHKAAMSSGYFDVDSATYTRQNSLKQLDKSNLNHVQSQGFKLSVLTAGGAGRTLLTRIRIFNNVPHIITLKLSTASRSVFVSYMDCFICLFIRLLCYIHII